VFIAAGGVLAVGGILLLEKVTATSAAQRHLSDLNNAYLFGAVGYDGAPMSWRRALIRITVASVIGLLPLLAVYASQVYLCARRRGRTCLSAILPLALAGVSILLMRNYFAHHPWMAPPVIIMGIVLSMRLLQTPTFEHQVTPFQDSNRLRPAEFAVVGTALAYGLIIALITAVNSEEDRLIRLVKFNTQRQDRIAFSSSRDNWIKLDQPRLELLCDRKFVELGEDGSARFRDSMPKYLLTASEEPAPTRWKWRTTEPRGFFYRAADNMLAVYRVHIARRARGDRIEAPACYLYDLAEVSLYTKSQPAHFDAQ
jgi:hypothetical protein